jgi:hypothetical protein
MPASEAEVARIVRKVMDPPRCRVCGAVEWNHRCLWIEIGPEAPSPSRPPRRASPPARPWAEVLPQPSSPAPAVPSADAFAAMDDTSLRQVYISVGAELRRRAAVRRAKGPIEPTG